MKKANVFAETYRNYLDQLSGIDLKERVKRLGGQISSNGVDLTLFGRKYYIDKTTIESYNGESSPSFAVKVVLCKYLLMCPPESMVANDELVSFRDFKDSGPLHTYFTNNTNKIIEQSFAGDIEKLRRRCDHIGGKELEFSGYDLSFTFVALPKIPIILNFNDRDDMFSAKATVLFRSDAEKYLDMECLAITATYLTGLLIRDY